MDHPHDRDLALALRLADVADGITMAHFRSESLAHELKDDGSPVSEADVGRELGAIEVVNDDLDVTVREIADLIAQRRREAGG